MSRGKLEDAAEHGFGIWNPKKSQILMQRFEINLSLELRHLEQGFHFGSKRQLSAALRVVEGLHAKMIARQKQLGPAGAQIADREGEHALEAMNAIGTVLFVEVDHDLCIGIGSEVMAFTLQFAAEFGEVVDFAVVGDPDRAVLVAHRHVTVGRKIEDGKAAAAEANVGAVRKSSLPQTRVVGAAVRLDMRHPAEHVSIAAICQTADAAH